MKWIATYRLESEFSHKDFEAYIKQLEKQKAEIERKLIESEADHFAGSQHELIRQDKKEELPAQATSDHVAGSQHVPIQQDKKEPPAQASSDLVATLCGDAPPTVTTSTSATSATSSRNQRQKKRGKKRKRIPPRPQNPEVPPNGGHHLMQPHNRHLMDPPGCQMGPSYSLRPSGYYGMQIRPNDYPFDPHRFSAVDHHHGRTLEVPLYGGRPVRFPGPRDGYSGPRW